MSDIEIGKRLKELRNKLDFTQTQFANKIGRTMQALQRYEAGKRELDLSMLILIEQVFNVNPSWLRTGVGEMFMSDNNVEQSHLKREVISKISELNEEQLSRLAGYIDSMQTIVNSGKKIGGGVLIYNIYTSLLAEVII